MIAGGNPTLTKGGEILPLPPSPYVLAGTRSPLSPSSFTLGFSQTPSATTPREYISSTISPVLRFPTLLPGVAQSRSQNLQYLVLRDDLSCHSTLKCVNVRTERLLAQFSLNKLESIHEVRVYLVCLCRKIQFYPIRYFWTLPHD
jgi:hypothetical protein